MTITGVVAMSLALVALFGRVMSFPLRHDEQMYLPVGALLSTGDLYQDLGFNNFPNLALLLHVAFQTIGDIGYLTTGRLVIFCGWLLAVVSMGLLVARTTRSAVAALVAMLMLVTSRDLLGPAGMIVTNNFLPLSFLLLGIYLFVVATDGPAPRRIAMFASGASLAIAVGFKANYVFLLPPFAIAVLMIPRGMGARSRALETVLPFAIGGLMGAIPVLSYVLRDPDGFLAHALRYHRGPHIDYWTAHANLDGTKIMAWRGKLALAARIWFAPGSALVAACGAYAGFVAIRRHGWRHVASWPVLLVGTLCLGAAAVSFVPTPAFPQYYVAPLPLIILLAALLYARLGREARAGATPVLAVLAGLAILVGAPRLLASLPAVFSSASRTGDRMHAAGAAIAAAAPARNGGHILATLAPIYALEGGFNVYPELAAGPLVYRVGDLIPAGDRKYYSHLASPTTITRVLDARPPEAILVGYEGALDAPLEAYALRHGYHRRSVSGLADRNGRGVLYVR